MTYNIFLFYFILYNSTNTLNQLDSWRGIFLKCLINNYYLHNLINCKIIFVRFKMNEFIIS